MILILSTNKVNKFFRNCIDKYSNNVIFLASCCNSQKVIESLPVQNECVLNIKSPTEQQLEGIADKIILENISLDKDVLEFIVKVL